jgi:DNA-binding CsgD family transcriptional regulator
VERHTLNIYAKLGVRSRVEAVAVDLHGSEPIGSA